MLMERLIRHRLLEQWMCVNRACFLLREILATIDRQKEREAAVAALIPFQDYLLSKSSDSAGCKALLEEIQI